MSRKWESIQGCTSGKIFDMVERTIAQPLGIMVFGADGESKTEAINTIRRELGPIKCYDETPDTATLVNALKEHRIIVIVLNTKESAMRDLRRELVKVMRNAGAKGVIGLYVKAAKAPLEGAPTLGGLIGNADLNKQLAIIDQSKPYATDGLDCLIVYGEGEE